MGKILAAKRLTPRIDLVTYDVQDFTTSAPQWRWAMAYQVIMRKLLFHLDNARLRNTRFLPEKFHSKASHHMFRWSAALPPDDRLLLTQEPVTH
jgi:hypothetical protein